MIDRKKIK